MGKQWFGKRSLFLRIWLPGEYTLLVKYYNSVFDKESDVYSLVIRIGDPWYASWWAYLIYALCLLLLAALLIRSFILRSKRKKAGIAERDRETPSKECL